MELEYIPLKGIKIKGKILEWGVDRVLLREMIGNHYTPDDMFLDNSILFGGDTSFNIDRKRDVYQAPESSHAHLFFNYNDESKLNEIELHSGTKVIINQIELLFGQNIDKILDDLKSNGYGYEEREPGNFLFKELKMVIADSESMGGDGNSLSYFYTSKNINHLL